MKILINILDILATAFILYSPLVLLRKTRSIYVLRGFFAIALFYVIAILLNLRLTETLFQTFVSYFIIIFVVVFQKEIRKLFENFSFSFLYHDPVHVGQDAMKVILKSVEYFAEKKIGALIVLPGKQVIERYIEGGILLDGKISFSLLVSIFDPKTPGHDGAVIIQGDMVKKFGAHLPLAENFREYGHIGTRHRAGLGMSERCDGLIIIVSEERGAISIAKNGKLKTLKSLQELKEALLKFSGKNEEKEGKKENKFISFFKYNKKEKLAVLLLSVFLWYILLYFRR